jgi:phosphopantothenoylcysteine synthetase/decarboxylase
MLNESNRRFRVAFDTCVCSVHDTNSILAWLPESQSQEIKLPTHPKAAFITRLYYSMNLNHVISEVIAHFKRNLDSYQSCDRVIFAPSVISFIRFANGGCHNPVN